ncbi:DNA cytosine methyltransferase [Lactiplantibacillus pentosus]|uniref:DNA cytosine methyltransferase n=1 Tax=Lactiplantibacillus pentosus TaxID=1589 RepID=UPI0026F920A0|nr:DNA cytosine methyltransferase [Lactiplantibacillus pentosus]MDO7806530.1 DNA cytosine methyltransferase [Lactiplantibacillus pentosus]
MTESVSSTSFTADAFFAGVGGIELGFKQTSKLRVLYANEFDKNARKTYALNNPNTTLDGRDIHDVRSDKIPNCEIMMGGFPCQAFSIAGYRKGFADERGDLFFEMLRMVNAKRPRVVFIENVKNLVNHDKGNTFKVIKEALTESGYFIKWKVLNGKDFGNVPQNRERIYVVAFRYKNDYDKFEFPKPVALTRTLHDVIDFHGQKDEKYYYRQGKQPFYDKLVPDITSQDTLYQWRRQYVRANKSHVSPTLTANMGTGGHNVPLLLTDSGEIRKLTPKECFNVQGYPADFKLPDDVANGQLYKQAGNSVVVPVIHRIAENIMDVISSQTGQGEQTLTGKYALLYTAMDGRYEGESYAVNFNDDADYLRNTALASGKTVLTDAEYLKFVKNQKHGSFCMIEETEA